MMSSSSSFHTTLPCSFRPSQFGLKFIDVQWREVSLSEEGDKSKKTSNIKEVGNALFAQYEIINKGDSMRSDLHGLKPTEGIVQIKNDHLELKYATAKTETCESKVQIKDVEDIMVSKKYTFLRFVVGKKVYIIRMDSDDDRNRFVRTLLFTQLRSHFTQYVKGENTMHMKTESLLKMITMSRMVGLRKEFIDAEILKAVSVFIEHTPGVTFQIQETLLEILRTCSGDSVPSESHCRLYIRYLASGKAKEMYINFLEDLAVAALHKSTSMKKHSEVILEFIHYVALKREPTLNHFVTKLYQIDTHPILIRNLVALLNYQLQVIGRRVNVKRSNQLMINNHSAGQSAFPQNDGRITRYSVEDELLTLCAVAQVMKPLLSSDVWKCELSLRLTTSTEHTTALAMIEVKQILKPFVLSIAKKYWGIMNNLFKPYQKGWLQVYKPLIGEEHAQESKKFEDVFFRIIRLYERVSPMRKFAFTMELVHYLDVLTAPRHVGKLCVIRALHNLLKLNLLNGRQTTLAVNALFWSEKGSRTLHWLKAARVEMNSPELRGFTWSGPKTHILDRAYTDLRFEKMYDYVSSENVEELDCSNSKITSKVAPIIADMRNLKILNLENTKFDDVGLDALTESDLRLDVLNLCGTAVSVSSSMQFHMTKPKTMVLTDLFS